MILRCLVAVACLASALPAAAQDPDITGTWDVSISTAQGAQSAPLVLEKEAGKLVGTFSGPQGDAPVEASLKDKAVTIWFSVPTESGPLTMTMTGTATADAMSGSIDFGGRGQARWSAKRPAAKAEAGPASAEAKLDVTGTWAFAVESAAGSGTPTITLKQDGARLTGAYSGQLGDAPIIGTVKGTAVEFTIDLSVQGTAVHIVYTGTTDGRSMKGTVHLGDFGDGTFTGKKTR